MEQIKRAPKADLSLYAPGRVSLEAKYGLPQEVVFCRHCVYSNQKPNSAREYEHSRQSKKQTVGISSEGVCDACRMAEKKTTIPWAEREKELVELCNRYRKTDGSYDCLVPGSGGKDSAFAAHILKTKYGMHPLTVTWAPHIYTDWGWKNFQSWIHAGFDNYLLTPNGRVHRLLTRLAVEQIFHPFQPFIMGQMYCAPKLAATFNIPLVFYGENPSEYGNPVLGQDSATKDWNYFTSGEKSKIFLAGVSVESLMKDFGLEANDLEAYYPPDPNVLTEKKVQVHYLGYYLKWHPQSMYYYAVEHCGFQAAPERTCGTYSKYSSIDDRIDDFHYYTTFIKFGIGRASYDAAQEIRSRDITRIEGQALVKQFDGEFPQRFAKEIYEFLSLPKEQFPTASRMFHQPIMDEAYFLDLCDQFRSPHLWQNTHGVWSLRHTVWSDDPSGAEPAGASLKAGIR